MQGSGAAPEPAVRTVDGAQVPDAGVYELDPVHTFISFGTRHVRIGQVRGRFTNFSGTITVGEDPSRTKVAVTVGTPSVDTHHETRDEDLRGARFFDVASFPTMTYRSTGAAYDGDGSWDIEGQLTIRDITRPLHLQARFRGAALDTRGNIRVGFQASAQLRREDFNLTADIANEEGRLPVGTDVDIEIDVEAILRA
jgi:polyisoprenoid-binding protein YceI